VDSAGSSSATEGHWDKLMMIGAEVENAVSDGDWVGAGVVRYHSMTRKEKS
jgi:hypothetical protein